MEYIPFIAGILGIIVMITGVASKNFKAIILGVMTIGFCLLTKDIFISHIV